MPQRRRSCAGGPYSRRTNLSVRRHRSVSTWLSRGAISLRSDAPVREQRRRILGPSHASRHSKRNQRHRTGGDLMLQHVYDSAWHLPAIAFLSVTVLFVALARRKPFIVGFTVLFGWAIILDA